MPFFGVPMRNGLPIGLGSVAGFGVQQFDPSQLFAGGTVAGAWYDPSDLSTMFTTSAGTTPVAMPGQGAGVAVGLILDKSQGLVLGSELAGSILGGTSGWTFVGAATVSGGAVVFTTPPSTNASAQYNPILTSGSWYRVQITLTGTGQVTVQLGSAGTSATFTAPGSYSFTGIASGGTPTVLTFSSVLSGVNNFVGSVTAVSVRTLPGNHAIAFNNTTTRPELRARVNLLVATATLSTQSVTTQATSYTLSFAGAGSITLSGTATGSYNAGTHTITCTAGTLTLTVSGAVTTADLRPANSGALLPAYQAVVDANTYDTSGFPLYLRFDGIDDSMYTPANLNLSGTDKVAVFAGVRKLSDAATGIVSELTAASFSTNGGFVNGAPDTGATYSFGSRGTIFQLAVSPASYSAPITNVITSLGDIAGDSARLRLNGAQVASNTSDQGIFNYANAPLYIGARNNSSLWFQGHLHSLIIAGSAVSAGNISATESWVAGRTGIAI